MKKEHKKWAIEDLVKNSDKIEFPEFQREPSIWKLEKKQRLIDSIFRDFDISSIYLYKNSKGKFECIDGQQRINAIWSYLGINPADDDNEFFSKINNEIYDDGNRFAAVADKRYKSLTDKYVGLINKYELHIVLLSNISEEEELNLQFLRLQLGAALNAGEKLNAMTGEMRDIIFNEIKELPFFNKLKIQNRRFAREQIASQIVLNAFSKRETGEFHRTRYLDLQDFFKDKEKFSKDDDKIINEIKNNLSLIEQYFKEKLKLINNRALAVSLYLFLVELIEQKKQSEIPLFLEFLETFLKTLKWQIPRGLDMDREYRNLLNFQTNVTQAAGEKTAIQKRHDFWREYFYFYKKEQAIIGDKEFSKKGNPNKERQRIIL